MKKTRVLLADDHKILLEGLRGILESEFEIVGAAKDGRVLVAEAKRLSPDVVVADLSFPVSGAANVVPLIKQHHPETIIIVVSLNDDPTVLNEVVSAGAEGFVLKQRAVVDLIPAIRAVCQGRRYVSDGPSSTPEP